MKTRQIIHLISLIGLCLSIYCIYWLWREGLLTNSTRLQAYISSFGRGAAFIFILIQIIQVVIPIIPGGISTALGVLMFGPWKGFLYNYLGIVMGSILVFLLAKYYGLPLLQQLFTQKQIDKYQDWCQEKDRFTKWFALAIFSPVAPDDFLCYLAGTTKMTLKTFTWIILLGKPLAIAAYSLGLTAILQFFFTGK